MIISWKLVEFFDEASDPLKIYFLEKIQNISIAQTKEKPIKMESMQELSKNFFKVDSKKRILNKAEVPIKIDQRKKYRSKRFRLDRELQKKNEQKVERQKIGEDIQTFKKKHFENQNIVKNSLNSQQANIMKRIQERRAKSFSKTFSMFKSREDSIIRQFKI